MCLAKIWFWNDTNIIGRYTLNIWDVGGQKTIRSYWRNYFEQTDGLVWVVDSSDRRRLDDCKYELDNLLKEEVHSLYSIYDVLVIWCLYSIYWSNEMSVGFCPFYSNQPSLIWWLFYWHWHSGKTVILVSGVSLDFVLYHGNLYAS